jgi:broad specificity phosphatase PhoE
MHRAAAAAAAALASLSLSAPSAHAGLLSLPAARLSNEYILVRAGRSVADAQGRARSGPATREASAARLSAGGLDDVHTITLPALARLHACSVEGGGCWIYYSTTAGAAMTAQEVAAALGVSQARLIPEYLFLDARGLGGLEGGQLDLVNEEVAAGDASSADWRPPAGTDGTKHESLADVLVRAVQVVSGTETKLSGAQILVIAPDGAALGVLQAAVEGDDLRSAAALAPPPGGVARLRTAPTEDGLNAVQ